MKRARLFGVLISLAVSLLVVGCGQPSAAPDAAKVRTEIAADFPAVDGSTTADPLLRLAMCKILDAPCGWTASTTENVQRHVVPDPAAPPDVAERINGIEVTTTHPAYMALIAGDTDLIIEARVPSEDEVAAAKEVGVTLDIQPVALDALVFLANTQNPVEDISIDTIIKVYKGQIKTWGELDVAIDGSDEPIHAYQRQRNSGSQELIDDLIMKGTPMVDAPEMITTSMVGPFNMIGGSPFAETSDGDKLGLGYTVFYYATAIFPHKFVKMVPVEGVEPTSANIASRKYPLTAEVYIVIREDVPAGSTTVALRDWFLSDEGQQVVAESGYVSIRSVTP